MTAASIPPLALQTWLQAVDHFRGHAGYLARSNESIDFAVEVQTADDLVELFQGSIADFNQSSLGSLMFDFDIHP